MRVEEMSGEGGGVRIISELSKQVIKPDIFNLKIGHKREVHRFYVTRVVCF